MLEQQGEARELVTAQGDGCRAGAQPGLSEAPGVGNTTGSSNIRLSSGMNPPPLN